MKRCAIYTRKSTEEGLEQDFNSLDAQREACLAYIASQKHEGWRPVRGRYDDGGYSGGSMDRPALKVLMDAVQRREIDIIVAYKVDRLSRSLMDFARMVEVFDAQGVSFVSVTQQFNTTDSMGRLTLNVLLSFAQFEREVTAERIRDKVAASKKKGMWMGGPVPLGYDSRNKKLVINEAEAKTVRKIFETYLEVGTVKRLQKAVDRLGLRTKVRGGGRGGTGLSRGHLYQILKNPIYVGRIAHREDTYPGLHEAIIDAETWDMAQRMLSGNAVERCIRTNTASPSLLSGLIYDEAGERLSPSHSSKTGKRYRYYISRWMMLGEDRTNEGWRIPAEQIERTVIGRITEFLNDHAAVEEVARSVGAAVVWDRVAEMNAVLSDGNFAVKRSILTSLVDEIRIAPHRLELALKSSELLSAISTGGSVSVADRVKLDVDVQFRRRGVEKKIVLGDRSEPDPVLCTTIARAHRWLEQLTSGEVASVSAIAAKDGVSPTDVSRDLQLAFLTPDIIEAILAGRQPPELTARRLRGLRPIPPNWADQREILGFDSIT